jgi:uncharacterized protein (UPF0147 family)
MTDEPEDMEEVFHGTVEEFLLDVSQDENLPDDVREEAYHWWKSLEDEFVDPTAGASEGQVEEEPKE